MVFDKELDSQTIEGKGGKLSVIIKFPQSDLLLMHTTVMNIIIIDGGVNH